MLSLYPPVKRCLKAFFALGMVSILLLGTAAVANALPADLESDLWEEDSKSQGAEENGAPMDELRMPGEPDDAVSEDESSDTAETYVNPGISIPQDEEGIPDTESAVSTADLEDFDNALANFALIQGDDLLTLKWEVKESENFVGQATVEIQGPLIDGRWGQTTTVADCVSATGDCGDSLDQDPAPGKFAITKRIVGTGGGYMNFRPDEIYRLRGTAAPRGYNWQGISSLWQEMSPGAWTDAELSYEFSTPLQLSLAPSIVWQVGPAVEGSSFIMEGPLKGNGNSWDHSAPVVDCVADDAAGCAGISVDQDPRAGHFKVHTMRWGTHNGFETHAISLNNRYRIRAHDSSVGFSWANPDDLRTTPANPQVDSDNAIKLDPFSLIAAASISWSVEDDENHLVGGATFEIRGEIGTDPSYFVTDCTQGPCHPESMDQDQKPGQFKIDTLRGLEADGYTQTVGNVSTKAKYTIKSVGSIPGYTWNHHQSIEVPENRDVLAYELETSFKVQAVRSESQLCTAQENANAYYSLQHGSGKALIRKYTHSGTAISTSAGEPVKEWGGMVHHQQTPDALGLTPTGVFYFTGQQVGGNAQQRNTTIYRFDPSQDQKPYPVFNMDLLSPTTGVVVSGDATIYNGREEFYFAYYSGTAPTSDIPDGIRFHLYRYSHGDGQRTGEVKHIDVPKPEGFSEAMDGDFVFDSNNNLQFIISDAGPGLSNEYVSGVVNAADFQADPSAHAIPAVRTIYGTGQFGKTNELSISGVAFTGEGRAIIQHYKNSDKALHAIATMPNLGNLKSIEMEARHLKDLASCSAPTTITLQTELIGDRYNPEDQFTLSASHNQSHSQDGEEQYFSEATTTGNQSGIQVEQVGPYVMTFAGIFSAKQSINPGREEENSYATSWACYEVGDLSDPLAQGEGDSFAIDFSAGFDSLTSGSGLLCIFTNVSSQADLDITKVSDPSSGIPVNQGMEITYTVILNNAAGTDKAEVAHVDHLEDVLDDAEFINEEGSHTPVLKIDEQQGIQAMWNADEKQITINGTVPAGEKRTLSYQIRVFQNDVPRSGDFKDYYLQSFVTPAGESKQPENCIEQYACTRNPINAWTVEMGSRPGDGARLHTGGNVHYQVVAQKLTKETTIDDLVFTSDLTDVFKTAGFAPEAVVPGGALKRGIYFFNAAGHTLNPVDSPAISASPNNSDDLSTAVAAYEGTDNLLVPIEDAEGTWTLTSPAVAVPANAVRIELWFAVEAGHHKEIPGAWGVNEAGNPVVPKTGSTFTNYVTATARDNSPLRCITGVEIEGTFPSSCQVTHELQDNYFTIRKDAQGPAVDAINLNSEKSVSDTNYGSDTTGMWNMIGHKFEVRDHDPEKNSPTEHPSRFLCRKDYDPRSTENWDSLRGEWIAGAPSAWNGVFDAEDLNDAEQFDWSENSETIAAIQSWNNAHPEDPLPICGLIYERGDIENLEESAAGQQTGRWRSEHLGAGEYWLVETKAPTHQISLDGKKKRPVPGVQLLAEPIPFKVWPDEASPDTSAAPANHGRGQLDISNQGFFAQSDWQERCAPGNSVSERPTACVNPTGYLLLVKDVTSIVLPLSGGRWLMTVTTSGLVILILAGIGIFWWRRHE